MISKEEYIDKIIETLEQLKEDEEIEINFTPNQIDTEYHGVDGDYVLLKNIIEIKSKRFIKVDDKNGFCNYGFIS